MSNQQRFYVIDPDNTIGARTPEELVRKMHKVSHMPADDDETWMMEVADRVMVQSGNTIRTDTAKNFVTDLIKSKIIERVE